jgi:phosphoribosyl-ATP pyrophosphohydrolase
MTQDVLARLAETIHVRRTADSAKSYTKQLLESGPERCAKKFGEEAIELVLAAAGSDPAAIEAEAADVLYHLLVVLESRNIPLSAVAARLEARMAQSGLEEKAARA